MCICCNDTLTARDPHILAPCGHHYCQGCLRDLVGTCVTDESLFPLRCCRQHFNTEEVFPLLPRSLLIQFRAKSAEFGTPTLLRLYCANPACSTFIGSSADVDGDILCPLCETGVCSSCKQVSHPGENCTENDAVIELKALAVNEHWQTCPGCHEIIELGQGCYHMTCRCRAEFCYVCAAPWKNCTCAIWDETRLLNAAQARVEDEVRARGPIREPRVFQERVQQRVEQLRGNHECVDHNWGRRNVPGTCPNCNDFLGQFLLVSH